MPSVKWPWGAALTCLLALGLHGSGSAQPKSESSETAAVVEERERQTNKSLLAALLERRAEIERTGTAEERTILPTIDKRIADVRSRIAQTDRPDGR